MNIIAWDENPWLFLYARTQFVWSLVCKYLNMSKTIRWLEWVMWQIATHRIRVWNLSFTVHGVNIVIPVWYLHGNPRFLSNYFTSSLASPPNGITWVEAFKPEVHRKCVVFLLLLLLGRDYNLEFTSGAFAKCRICTNSSAINIDILLYLEPARSSTTQLTFFSPLWGHP